MHKYVYTKQFSDESAKDKLEGLLTNFIANQNPLVVTVSYNKESAAEDNLTALYEAAKTCNVVNIGIWNSEQHDTKDKSKFNTYEFSNKTDASNFIIEAQKLQFDAQ